MNLLNHNIEILSKNPNHRIREITEKDLCYKYIGRDANYEYFVDDSENVYRIEHSIDKEGLPNSFLRELYVIVGIYGVEEIQYLIQNANPYSIFIVIEPTLSFFLSALQYKDLSHINKSNVTIVVSPIHLLSNIIEDLLKDEKLFLAVNIKFYATYFYRTYDLGKFREIVKMFSDILKYRLMSSGNSIEDSLIGMKHDLINLKYMINSRDVSKLKGAFQNVPAIVVSAGPSLDKNIKELKNAQGKCIMLAVDTIAEKLLKEGIVPDFICSIERVDEVYNYFYKGKSFPEEVTLAGPPVLKPNIFEEFKGEMIIPLRKNVAQYYWLNKFLGLNKDSFVSMGLSCAHVAFGLAAHFGASPIILVGQDLAYAEDGQKTHSSGTIYDKGYIVPRTKTFKVNGYYGGQVESSEIWNHFRKWFEQEILRQNLFVINATEGGSKIEHTLQMPLKETIEKYCRQEVNVYQKIISTPKYQINIHKFVEQLKEELYSIQTLSDSVSSFLEKIRTLNLQSDMSKEDLKLQLKTIDEVNEIIWAIFKNSMLVHLFQSTLITTFWKMNKIERDTLNFDTVSKYLGIVLHFTQVVHKTLKIVLEILSESIENIK
ncbi:6-hydroxymethylpterin diphosphokinase MptE-like protein [Parageobacillus toebii]|uniref:motility associated factor glycosyltransferase family protein n=1 Tax=Parageobacillus toebii TaxID=153151 RepID=UPI0035C68D8A